MKLTYIKQAGEPNGDGGDQYTGLDRFGRVVDQRWPQGSSELERVDYGFTPASNRQWRQNRVAANGQDEYYSYDGLYQVAELNRGTLNSGKTGISGTPSWTEDFTYDPIGNWNNYLTKVSGVTNLDQSRTHNTANQTTEIDGSTATVGHDLAGNMVKVPQVNDWAATFDLTWDAWNRLVEVADGESTVAQYRYDGKTRRMSKETDVARHYYYSDRWQILEERVDAETTAERQFIWGQRYLDDLVLRDRDVDDDGSLDERLYVLSDYFNPTAIADEDGVVVERYGYNAFGLSRVMDADFEPRSTSDYDWETRYGAYRWDGETGFYQVRYRYLHPTLGRWLSKDPMHEKGGINLYCYVINNSVNRVDKNGLAGLTWSKPTIEDYALAYDASFTKKKYGPPKSWSGLAKRKAAELFAKGMGGLNPTLFQHYLHGGGKAYDLSSSKMIKGEAIAAVQPQIDDALTEISGQAETFGCVEPFGVYTWGDSGFSKTVREGFGSKVWVIGSAEAGISKQCGAVVICCNGKKTAYVNCDFHLYFYDQFADAAHIFGHDPAGIDVEEFIGGLQFDEIGAWGRKISKTGTSF